MYKLIPMTRLGLESYQGQLADLFKRLNALVGEGTQIYRVKETFSAVTKRFPEGHLIFPGSFIVPADLKLEGVQYDLIEEEISFTDKDKVVSLTLRKIAFLDGKNCASFCSDPFYNFFESYGLNVDRLTDDQVREGMLDEYDILIVPGGPDAGESYYEGLGEKGFDEIRVFLNRGGSYLGSCAGSYFPLTSNDHSFAREMWLNILPVTDPQGLDYWRTGTGFVRIEVENASHPVTYGVAIGRPSTFDMIYWEGPAFELLDQERVTVIARFKDFIASGRDKPSWSLENNPIALDAMKWSNPLTEKRFEKYLQGAPAIIEGSYGKGRMVLISPHAEFGTCGTEHEMKDDPIYLLLMNSIYYLSKEGE